MSSRPSVAFACWGLVFLGSCSGTPTPLENEARASFADVRSRFRPGDAEPELPVLSAEASLAEFLRYAVLRHPRVAAAYYDWAAAIERITLARSRPDPRLTFESDVTDMVDVLLVGLMTDLPGPGKLKLAADARAAEAEAQYFAFAEEVLRAAFDLKVAYFRHHFIEDTLRVRREALTLIEDVERLAEQQVGAGRGTIQDVLRAQIEREQLATQIQNLADSKSAIEAEFRAALGHDPGDLSIPLPSSLERSAAPCSATEILAIAGQLNPRLGRLETLIRRGEARIELAEKSGVPDFMLGLELDVLATPLLWRPTARGSLPIWRDRIAAEIAMAEAEKASADARLSAEQLSLAAELAALLYTYRESSRNDELFATVLVPKARQSLDAARSGYSAGRSSFLDVIDAERQLLAFELSVVEARTQRELALASISLLIAGVAPEEAGPILSTPKETQP